MQVAVLPLLAEARRSGFIAVSKSICNYRLTSTTVISRPIKTKLLFPTNANEAIWGGELSTSAAL